MEDKRVYSNVKSTAKHGVIYGFGQIIYHLTGLLLIPIYTIFISPHDYGILSILLIFNSILNTIFTVGLNTSFLRTYGMYDDKDEKGKVLFTAVAIIGSSALLLQVIGAAFGKMISNIVLMENGYNGLIYLSFLSTGMLMLQNIGISLYRAENLSTKYNIFNIAYTIIKLSITIYLVKFMQLGILGVLLGELTSNMLSLLYLYFDIRKFFVFAFLWNEAKSMLAYGSHLVIGNLSGLILVSSDSYFLNYFHSAADVGIYNIAYKYSNLLQVVLIYPFKLIWLPMIYKMYKKEYAKKYFSLSSTYFIVLALFVTSGAMLFSNAFIRIFTAKPYWSSVNIIPYILLSYLFMGFTHLFGVGLMVEGKTNVVGFGFVIGALVNLPLNYLLIPKFNMYGAAIATLLSYIVTFASVFYMSDKVYKVEYEWYRLAKGLIVFLIVVIMGYMVTSYNLVNDIICKVVIIIAYPILLFLLRFFNNEEKDYIIKYIRKIRKKDS